METLNPTEISRAGKPRDIPRIFDLARNKVYLRHAPSQWSVRDFWDRDEVNLLPLPEELASHLEEGFQLSFQSDEQTKTQGLHIIMEVIVHSFRYSNT